MVRLQPLGPLPPRVRWPLSCIVIVLIGVGVSMATPSMARGGQRNPFFTFCSVAKQPTKWIRPFALPAMQLGGQRNPLSIFYKKWINEGALPNYNLNQHKFSFENFKAVHWRYTRPQIDDLSSFRKIKKFSLLLAREYMQERVHILL